MKILSILETPYRGTLEEQDDASLWFTHAVSNAGKGAYEVGILLRGNAVNYAVTAQNAEGLRIGNLDFERPCKLDQDLVGMKEAGMKVLVVREDLADRGISTDSIAGEFELVERAQIGGLVSQYDQVWHW
jgi:sulfur relay (sulfurtransferase) DsrF/TusC family protein